MARQFVLFRQIKWIGATLPAFVHLSGLPALIDLLSDPYCVAICVIRIVTSCWSLLHLLTQFV